VYVNYGVPEDYQELSRRGIDVRDKIVIARYGKGWRGVKPKLAQEHGAVGCLIYSDPREDGFYEGDVYPVGPYRPGQGVQRGSVMDMALYPGDPLTPGWASDKGARRLPRSEAKSLMRIPVLPISADDAEPLVAALGGPVPPESWRGALPVTYHIGPGPATVHLKLDFDWTSKPLYDVVARIPGSVFPDQWIMWGNHHDAWVNGASDPVSGASSLLDAARSIAEMVQRGWKPKRTILFAFWDAEEFGLVGSTEWAEKHQAELDRKLAVYLNSDSTGRGSLNGSGSHALEQFVNEIASDVADPLTGISLAETMTARRASGAGKSEAGPAIRLGPLGAGSDYVPFIDHLGVSSLNLAFGGDDVGGVYHSVYDSFQWYARFSDRDFLFGRTLSQVMAVALMRLADASVLPYEFGSLARTVRTYADEIQKQSCTLDLRNVYAQIGRLEGNSHNYEEALASAGKRLGHAPPAKIEKLNQALFRSERTLLSAKGLPGRQWYRHELYAPGLYTGYGAKTLPGIREAVEGSRWDEANQEAGRVVQALKALNTQVEEAVRLLREIED
jgi:N-acetylated-alpha-linked acidic dipeptidase